jgi:hypothetical protein
MMSASAQPRPSSAWRSPSTWFAGIALVLSIAGIVYAAGDLGGGMKGRMSLVEQRVERQEVQAKDLPACISRVEESIRGMNTRQQDMNERLARMETLLTQHAVEK